ncbi:MAG: hypothetical protein M3Z09_15215 [Acidobacteriota bacterium]|nr:hypothetical protein [Acidobacteriota bacterium]
MSPQPQTELEPNPSTGPKTEAGKAVSSRNALRHGLASGAVLIPGEDPEAFPAFALSLKTLYAPANAIEEVLVADMARHHWLKDRAMRLQDEGIANASAGQLPDNFAVLLRYQTTNERAFHKAFAALTTLQKERKSEQREFVSQYEDGPGTTARQQQRAIAAGHKKPSDFAPLPTFQEFVARKFAPPSLP